MKFALPIRFGIATSGCLIAYFLILSLFSLHINAFFSLFNTIITGFGVFEVIKYTKLQDGINFNYRRGFLAGIVTGFMATLIFTIFFAFYATEINISFLPELSKLWFKDYHTGKGFLFFMVGILGFATTVVLTLTFMQLFKSTKNLKKK